VWLKLSSRDVFVIEPRMTGLMLLENPPDRGHLRLEWKLKADTSEQSLWFWDRRGLGTVRLFSAAEFEKELGPERLGYDALEMTVDRWEAVLKKTSRAIKVALLDQRCVAGIGNIYASEILHLAGISPEQPSKQLDHEALEKLADASVSVLNKAIASEGSTLRDGTYRNALNQNGRYQNQHRVYQKHGKICPTCKRGTIDRIVLAQRATFFCPVCQPIVKTDK